MFSIARKLSPLSPPRIPLHFFHLTLPHLVLPPPPPTHLLPSAIPARSNVFFFLLRSFSSQLSSQLAFAPPLLSPSFIRGGSHEIDESNHPICSGCGVHMQGSDSSLPGFFSLPSIKSPDYRAPISPLPISSTSDPETSHSIKSGNIREIVEGKGDFIAEDTKPLVCARCHSLRHYGRVKNLSAENLLPDFDFNSTIAPKIASSTGSRSVVLFVVDAADFDGSFPRKTARFISSSIERNARAWKESKPANIARIVLVITKLDLLPPSISPETLLDWARRRASFFMSAKLTGLHLVSAVRDWGVGTLIEQVTKLAGPRGNVWAVGAQNAGKSTLINSMGRFAGIKKIQLTEAALPGTTLGIVRVEGVLSGQAKLFDTPGILHPYQITTRLNREEQKLVHISKELKPRTYRIKAGHSVYLGGLMSIDVEESSSTSIYLTVWASPLLPLHMGKKENSHKLMQDHFGRQLQPPIGETRVDELGKWMRTEFRVAGNSWDVSTTDIAAAGLGWVAVCLNGEAVLGVWTYDGIDVVSRSSLIALKANVFEEAGFTISKIVSRADSIFDRKKRGKSDVKRSAHKAKLPGEPPSGDGVGE